MNKKLVAKELLKVARELMATGLTDDIYELRGMTYVDIHERTPVNKFSLL